jgi:hypothetical protein
MLDSPRRYTNDTAPTAGLKPVPTMTPDELIFQACNPSTSPPTVRMVKFPPFVRRNAWYGTVGTQPVMPNHCDEIQSKNVANDA